MRGYILPTPSPIYATIIVYNYNYTAEQKFILEIFKLKFSEIIHACASKCNKTMNHCLTS